MPPPADPSLAFPRDGSRPGAVVAFGWLNIAFGLLGALFSPGFLIVLLIAARYEPDDPSLARIAHDATYRFYLFTTTSVVTLACLAELASGVGLLRRRRWGWRTAIAYAVFSLVYPVAEFVVDYALSTHRDLIAAGRAGDQEQVETLLVEGAVHLIVVAATMLYAALLLYGMIREDVRRWFWNSKPSIPPPR